MAEETITPPAKETTTPPPAEPEKTGFDIASLMQEIKDDEVKKATENQKKLDADKIIDKEHMKDALKGVLLQNQTDMSTLKKQLEEKYETQINDLTQSVEKVTKGTKTTPKGVDEKFVSPVKNQNDGVEVTSKNYNMYALEKFGLIKTKNKWNPLKK